MERNEAQRFGVLDRKAERLRHSKIRDLERKHLPVLSELLEPIPDRHALWKKSDEKIKSTRTDAVLESQPDQAEREESVEIFTIDETGDSLSSLR